MGTFSNLCCDFDGVNDHVVVGDVAAAQFERTDPFSVCAWIRTTSSASFDAIISKLDGSSPFPGWEFLVDSANDELVLQLINTVTTDHLRVDTSGASPAPNDGQWHHVVVTYDGSSTPGGVTFYIDGTPQSNSTVTDTLGSTIATTTPLQIGARDGTNLPFQGRIDDAGIYDKELSGAEVTAVYGAGDPPDLTSAGPTGNLVGYWLMGDGDTFPTLTDNSANSNDGTMTNMVAGDIVFSSAGGLGGCEVALDAKYCADVDRSAGDGCTYALGGTEASAYYKMRGQDSGATAPGYVTWTSGTQDFDGADSGSSSPPIVGTLIPGSVRVVSRWFPVLP